MRLTALRRPIFRNRAVKSNYSNYTLHTNQGIALKQINMAWRNGTQFEVRPKRDGSGK